MVTMGYGRADASYGPVFPYTFTFPVTYWEGAIETSGTAQGKPIRGQGYMELTGYAERVPSKL